MADEIIKKIPVTSVAGQVPATNTTPPERTVEEIQAELDAEDGPFGDVKKEMKARYDLSADDIKALIIDPKFQETLFNIAKANKLTYDELGILEVETTLVLLGITKEPEYSEELQLELRKNDPEITPIVKAVKAQVFDTVRTSLDHLSTINKDPEAFVPESLVSGRTNVGPITLQKPITPTAPINTVPVFKAPTPTQTVTPSMSMNAIGMNSLSSSEKAVLEKTGVILNDIPKPQMTPSVSTEKLNRDDLIASIENPMKSRPVNIVASKLATTGPVIAPKVTDYTLPKVNQPTTPATPTVPTMPLPRSGDPYREPIN